MGRCGPDILALIIESEDSPSHLTQHAPSANWHYSDAEDSIQTVFDIAVGTDNDWQIAEMWNPAPFVSSDTFVVYAGAPLIDGQTYYLRLRVANVLGWSDWYETLFRMNSVPTVPELRLPLNNAIVNTEHPQLTIRNPLDAEGDSLYLTVEVSTDSSAFSGTPIVVAAANDSLTNVLISDPLVENKRHFWRVKASDYYEESGYSPICSFWVNSANSAPSGFGLVSPGNSTLPQPSNNPLFSWQSSLDVDPLDSVRYTLYVASDSLFNFSSQIPGLVNPTATLSTPLEWARNYWWKVRASDLNDGATWSNQVFRYRTMMLGDADGNGSISIADAVYLINYIFAGGPAPNPLLSGDADCNGSVSIADAVYLINYIFASGPPPCDP